VGFREEEKVRSGHTAFRRLQKLRNAKPKEGGEATTKATNEVAGKRVKAVRRREKARVGADAER